MEFYERESILKALKEIGEELQDAIHKSNFVIDNELNVINKNAYYFLDKLANNYQQENNLKRTLLFLLRQFLFKSENLCPNSSGIFFVLFLEFAKNVLKYYYLFGNKNESELRIEYESAIEKVIDIVKNSGTIIPPTKELLERYVNDLCEDKLLTEIVLNAVGLAGLEGKIRIERDMMRENSFIIEARYGYYFNNAKLDSVFSNENIDINNVKVMVVDGIVEKVSELDKIFNKVIDTGIPLVIISSGFSEEVIATLRINYNRNIFKIFPIKVETDLDTLNVINDISIVCGADIISSLKGDMILFADFDKFPIVSRIKCNSGGLIIENISTRKEVERQIEYLTNKLNESELDIVKENIEKRIRNLNSYTVIIRIPNFNETVVRNWHIKFDTVLRNVRVFLNSGIINRDKIIHCLNEQDGIVFELIKNSIENYKLDNYIPTMSFVTAIKVFGNVYSLFLSPGGAIV
ncbi:MAG: hypothetical protein QXO21_00065 [Candidatus Anstonellales archaeon]